jgi:endonuclease/exonuclease/phosphatase (EEP) superfamily protein YafD
VAALAVFPLSLLLCAWRLSVAALASAVVLGVTQVPLFTAEGPVERENAGHIVSVMSLNLYSGGADSAEVVALVRRHHVDLLLVQQLVPDQASRLRTAGLEAVLPYAHRSMPGDSRGTGMYSRYPLREPGAWKGFRSEQIYAHVSLPGHDRPLVAASVHPTRVRYAANGAWRREQAQLARRLADIPGQVIAGGDFNASYDHAAFRRYISLGYEDAAESRGSGLLTTWPVRDFFLPFPFVGIDHILARGGAEHLSADAATVPGSDHRAVLARIWVPQ